MQLNQANHDAWRSNELHTEVGSDWAILTINFVNKLAEVLHNWNVLRRSKSV